MDNKICSVCKKTKPIATFNNETKGKDGLRSNCKDCDRERSREYHKANKERINERHREYSVTNKERIKKNRDDNNARIREWQVNYREENREWLRERNSEWCKNNREIINKYLRNRHANDDNYRVLKNIRSRLRAVLSTQGAQKSASTVRLTGCSIEELIKYIGLQFTDGMSWDNYGYDGWHIDHIVPCAAFDLTDPEQQEICFHYTNLQPLWAKDNMRKNGKLPHEFSAIQA